MKRNCGNCYFGRKTILKRDDNKNILCHRYPIYYNHMPHEWCGEHRTAEEFKMYHDMVRDDVAVFHGLL